MPGAGAEEASPPPGAAWATSDSQWSSDFVYQNCPDSAPPAGRCLAATAAILDRNALAEAFCAPRPPGSRTGTRTAAATAATAAAAVHRRWERPGAGA